MLAVRSVFGVEKKLSIAELCQTTPARLITGDPPPERLCRRDRGIQGRYFVKLACCKSCCHAVREFVSRSYPGGFAPYPETSSFKFR